MAETLPTFEEVRAAAAAQLDADQLHTAWAPECGPDLKQAEALLEAMQSIAKARAALKRAAR